METRFLTLLFTYPKHPKITSKIIKWRLKTKYSHVAGVVSTGPIGLYDVYQASGGNVHGLDLCEFLNKNKVIKTCRISFDDKEDYYALIRYLKRQRGKDYSIWAAIASTFPLMRKLGIGLDGDNKFICSEYMARALEETKDFDYGEHRKNADYVDPEIFEQMLIDLDHTIYEGLHFPEYKGQC
jgi:hypothetical protein